MKRTVALTAFFVAAAAGPALADCANLPDHGALREALRSSVKPSGGPTNGGLDLHMWATVVDRDGVVCAVTFSGDGRGDQWPGSRVISAQKANTANAFSLDGLALSTANLFTAVQSGNSLFGLQESNPVNTAVAYAEPSSDYGGENDPMKGKKIGGVNVFGGGLALYRDGKVIGGLGVSGDTSCADHNVGWRVREALKLGQVPGGVGPNNTDGINYDIGGEGKSKGGFGHPVCGGKEADVASSIKAGGGQQ